MKIKINPPEGSHLDVCFLCKEPYLHNAIHGVCLWCNLTHRLLIEEKDTYLKKGK